MVLTVQSYRELLFEKRRLIQTDIYVMFSSFPRYLQQTSSDVLVVGFGPKKYHKQSNIHRRKTHKKHEPTD